MAAKNRALAGLLIAFLSLNAGAEDNALETQPGVLVLRNGFVLRGQITPINDLLLVSLSEGGDVRLPRAEVAFQCRDLDEAYLQQRDRLKSDEPDERLRLADWCLRQGLLSRAADQLLVVFNQEPSHPRLRVLEQRLLALKTPPVTASQPATAVVTPPPPSPNRLSSQSMNQFSTVVQPILLNRCATHACHGNGSAARYRLIRPSSGHATTSRMTQRNLQATLQFTDAQRPENSPLLVQAGLAHGGAAEPPFSEKQRQQLELVESWLRRAINTPVANIATNSGGPQRSRVPQGGTDLIKPTAGGQKASPVQPAQHSTPVPDPRSTSPGAKETPSANTDPFDPEIFNRRFHPPAGNQP